MRFRILLAVLCALGFQNAMGAGDGPYKFLKDIQIGGEGGWDILTVDSAAHRLYSVARHESSGDRLGEERSRW